MSSRLGSRRLLENSPRRWLLWSSCCALRASVSNTYLTTELCVRVLKTESGTYTTNFSTSSVFGLNDQLKHVNVTTLTYSGFTGFTFQPGTSPISLTDSFLPVLTNVLSPLSPSTFMPARKISSFSRMSHFAPFLHSDRLHLRFLQFWFKAKWYHHQLSWDTPIQLDADFLTYLHWFHRRNVMTGVPLHLPEPSLFFFTVASLTGWNASWKDHQISGLWQLQNHNVISTG